ncbi:hypothetical protein GHK86_04055 [Acidimicrobiaceae bacterium USS-CC1]|uniref:Helix-turn-helix domain-containing protein n=1 Tax=Acidiferrimicrobium australe TaxID=2664430 RepID=A0ABW9QQ06_9ACTN|nr:hypothetical protein [Acidiferrimicrobium australe]
MILSLRDAGLSTRAIGAALGVSNATVSRTSAVTNETPAPVVGRDGKQYNPKPKPEASPDTAKAAPDVPDLADMLADQEQQDALREVGLASDDTDMTAESAFL